MRAFEYENVKHIATISSTDDGSFTTEINLIRYGTGGVKVDIRKWDRRHGEEIMRKGITLNYNEATALRDALCQISREQWQEIMELIGRA